MTGRTRIRKELRDSWVAALRSGKYEQGFGMLADNRGRYCPLGVLAVIQGFDFKHLSSHDRTTSVLSEKLGGGLHPALMNTISRLNDHKRMSFESIAHFIENQVPARK